MNQVFEATNFDKNVGISDSGDVTSPTSHLEKQKNSSPLSLSSSKAVASSCNNSSGHPRTTSRKQNKLKSSNSLVSEESSPKMKTTVNKNTAQKRTGKKQLEVGKKSPAISSHDLGKDCFDELIGNIASIGLSKINYDIEIDPGVVERYTDTPLVSMLGTVMPPPESPETQKKRIESKNMIIARQCRLHPENEKYNQGPVNVEPILQGKLVGYTPAGQRHEVDLNFDRPNNFNSEYARMQFDYATRINVSRMFHELQSGRFLPKNLDVNIERRYFFEKELVTKGATEHFKNQAGGLETPETNTQDNDDGAIRLLESELQLIELIQFALVRLEDFPKETNEKLQKALNFKMTPLIFKKNPIIVESLEKLSTHCDNKEVASSARALLNKIMTLFQVPKSQNFKDYFASEVKSLMEKTKDIPGFDVLMMTESPQNNLSNDCNNLTVEQTVEAEELFSPTLETKSSQTSDLKDGWTPVRNGEFWINISENNSGGNTTLPYLVDNNNEPNKENCDLANDTEGGWSSYHGSEQRPTDEQVVNVNTEADWFIEKITEE